MWGHDIRLDRKGVFSKETYSTFALLLGEIYVSTMLLFGYLPFLLFG
jgi:hypothetical protein